MITEILKAILAPSLAGGALTLIIAAAHPFTKRRFPAGWNYYIWLAVLFVMLCPVRISLPESVRTAAPNLGIRQMTVTAGNPAPIAADSADNTPRDADTQAAPTLTARTGAANELREAAADKLALLSYIWLITAAALFAAKIISYAAFRRRLKKSSQVIDLPEIALYTKRRVTARKSADIISPLITGVFRPVLLLPETELTDGQLRYVLLHEATHLNRRDILYKWLAAIVKCVHWFNPAVYFAAARINAECEISCDLSVTDGMTRAEKAEYAQTILTLLSAGKRAVPMTTGMTGGKRILRRRFEMIRDKRDIGKRARIVSAALAVIMTASAVLAGGALADGILGGDVTIEITVNGEKLELINKPFIEDNTVYLPLREIFYKLGLMDNEECYMEWNDGRIEFCIADKADNIDSSEHENTEFVSVWAVEIGRNELIYNAFEHTPSETTQSFINAPVLKEDLTYIPYSYVEFLLNAASPNEWNINCFVYDKNGNPLNENGYDSIGYVTGRLGIITEDVKLKDAYAVTIDEKNNYVTVKLDNSDFFLHKNDMVIVLDENEKNCRVMQAFGDIPVLRGTIDKNLINYDTGIFKTAANQAIADNVMGYDSINGNEMGFQIGAGIVKKREADWVLLSIPMMERDFWFKSDDLSYDFDTEVMDIITMPAAHTETAPTFTGDGFSVAIPVSWSGKYMVNTEESGYGTSYSFIQKVTYEKYGAGVLCSIEKVRRDDADEILDMLGGSELLYRDENYAYIYAVPTDVQYPVWADRDEEDAAIAAEYREMFEQVDFIKNSFEMTDHTETAPTFTVAEAAAAGTVNGS